MLISYEDFKKTSEYDSFIKENPDIGNLKVQAFTAYGAIPIPNTDILITKNIGDYQVTFFKGKTDSSGMISNIKLPAPTTSAPNYDTPLNYTIYDLTAIHTGYEEIKKYSIGMFGGVGIIQYIKMNPEINLEGVENNAN